MYGAQKWEGGTLIRETYIILGNTFINVKYKSNFQDMLKCLSTKNRIAVL